MKGLIAVLAVFLVVALALSGCSGDSGQTRDSGETAPLDEESAEAASTRGVSTEDYGREESPAPKVVLETIAYEWRTSPDVGLAVTMEFVNPADTYERARGYVFLVAESSRLGSSSRSIYPWSARLDGDLPEEYTDGTHLLYRDEQTVRCFIPYEFGSGYFDKLRLMLFSEDGNLLLGRTYDLEITGEPRQSKTINPGFDL
jgi:hypothetical protein